MDALSDVLRAIRLNGGVFLHAELSDPWCLGVDVSPLSCSPLLTERSEIIPYHYVLEGCLRVQMPGQPPVELAVGDVVLFPRNDPHVLGGDLSLPPAKSAAVVQRPTPDDLLCIRAGGGGALTRIVCGYIGADDLWRNPAISGLPAALYLRMRDTPAADWVESSFKYAAIEVASGRIGSETVLAKLSELLLVHAVRQYAESLPEGQRGWLAGLKDPYVGRALTLLHGRPSELWSVESLGREVGLSRSALSDRFIQVLGVPPMQYLTNWRMQLASQELRQTSKSLAEIAQIVGYESEAAFSRAFKRIVGQAPGTFRRRRGERSS